MSRRLRILFLALLAAGCGEPGTRYLSLGTAGTGGLYYPLGGALANLLSQADTTRRFTAEVTGGSVENVNRLRSHEIDLGISMGTTAFEAYRGGPDFAQPHGSLRIVAPLYPNVTHVLVRAGSSLRSIAEFTGRRVSVGAPGSGTEQLAGQLLEAYGVPAAEVRIQYLSFNESAAALKDGAIDAAIISAGYPASAVLEATTTSGARLLPVNGPGAERMLQRYSYYLPARIPAGAYPGVTADIPTVAVMNWLLADESLDADVVTLVLDLLRDHRDRLVEVHEIARQIDLDMLRSAPIPLHPAATRWLEAGAR